ncbi:DNA-3-methyladenine glycosylase I [Desulfocapsa sulfexigens DSM 10523]|uniref:DNA-3-methyladenine glycosylase I n=1 Tax=Desulfocapsa sulfexigens (strain DSM 10523 / SB164P1) TaxID=1167006 RepID=M1PA38_DESSD|nr:DNA-3-methyladenine glycosylase I [Desulfocapsa sulfexigens]AGF76670.1 DNA-3-methyladenine glycosylase I [Desulfocapsa sulfexigens DSM 10523]
MKKRCGWCTDNSLYQEYHDKEWGVPLHNERELFEFLCLEGAQAGLSWITILKKRENYRQAFDYFDAEKIALYNDTKISTLLQDTGIVRNKLKVNAFVNNARCYLAMLEKGETLDELLWSLVDGKVIQNNWKRLVDIPPSTPLSDLLCKELKQRGFTFVGGTICYAFMQAIGMVNDHTTDCFRHQELR